MLIDSGSDITVLSLKFCRAIQLAFKPISSPPKAIGVTGNAIKLVGCVNNACIETKDGFFIDNVWVAKDLNTDAILGDSSLSAFQALTIRYGGHLPTLEVKEVRIESSNFANCAPVSCFPITTKTPCRAPSRRKSQEDKAFIKVETEKLFRERKIQHSNSPWRSQAFVVRENGKTSNGNRLCPNN